jgi:hypothetical protein
MSKRSSDEEIAVVAASNGAEEPAGKKPRLDSDPDPTLPDVCLFITDRIDSDEHLEIVKFRVASTPKAALIIKEFEEARRIDKEKKIPDYTYNLMGYIQTVICNVSDEDKKLQMGEQLDLVSASIKALSNADFGEWVNVSDDPNFTFGLVTPVARMAVYYWCSSL